MRHDPAFSLRTYSPFTILFFFFFNDTATTEIYTLSLHDALPISGGGPGIMEAANRGAHDVGAPSIGRSEEHTSELQSLRHLVCRLLLEKKKKISRQHQRPGGVEQTTTAPHLSTHTISSSSATILC